MILVALVAIATRSSAAEVDSADRPGWASGQRGVVAAEHVLAAEAGVEMLAAGGNAIDAAVAAAFVNGVVNPSSCGIGGGGFLLAYTAVDGRTRALDFRERAPAGAHRDMYVKDGEVDGKASLEGASAVAVPGEVRGLAEALETLGTLPLARVLEPAIRHAEKGFPVGEHLASMIAKRQAEIRKWPDLATIYLHEDGAPYRSGERLVQRDLAVTLRSIATEGPEAYYSGAIGSRIANTVANGGGTMTKRDLIAYRTAWREPLSVRYHDHEVIGFPPPSSGGGVILEVLNVLEGFRAPSFRFSGPRDARSLHLLMEASKLAFADRAFHYGDPDFAKVPLDRLLSAEHARALREKISLDALAKSPEGITDPEHGGTAHLSTLDAAGNAAALTSTVNTAFGSMVVVPGTGIVLNNQMDDFAAAPGVANVYGLVGAEANSIRPGKRPLSSMSPTLVKRGGRVRLALGGSGGPFIISATLQTLLRVVDLDEPVDRAIAAPRLHHQWKPDRLFVERTLAEDDRRALEAIGHRIVEVDEIGAVQAVAWSPEGLTAAADLRKGGDAAAW